MTSYAPEYIAAAAIATVAMPCHQDDWPASAGRALMLSNNVGPSMSGNRTSLTINAGGLLASATNALSAPSNSQEPMLSSISACAQPKRTIGSPSIT
ncbi:hypothetical protein [Paraburkholderia susongensis]|uniref:hypothetical protein n=1 Tax=Paraburkholderia susongensis TaxID=1515439 RepID=UPI00142D1FB1|nr:hypothetical protein [Paraburkholderia susongensis]